MPFWDDLNTAVKRYLLLAVVLLAGVIAFRACANSAAPAGKPVPRGVRGG